MSAQNHFALAEEVGSQTTETGIKALIAKASCYSREDDWPTALKEAQKAAALADKRHSATPKAEALLGACVCLVNMQDTARVGLLLAELTNTPLVTVATKRKACREVILALSDLSLTQESLQYEHKLRNLLPMLDDTEEWEQVKTLIFGEEFADMAELVTSFCTYNTIDLSETAQVSAAIASDYNETLRGTGYGAGQLGSGKIIPMAAVTFYSPLRVTPRLSIRLG